LKHPDNTRYHVCRGLGVLGECDTQRYRKDRKEVMGDPASQRGNDTLRGDLQRVPHVETEDQLKNVQTAEEDGGGTHRLDLPVRIMPKSNW
jgi:hypothetical protein